MVTKQLVLIGGGHAHMVTLAKIRSFIDNGFGVTVIQPSDYHYYSGMGPGMLGGTYQPDDIRFQGSGHRNTRRFICEGDWEQWVGNFFLYVEQFVLVMLLFNNFKRYKQMINGFKLSHLIS